MVGKSSYENALQRIRAEYLEMPGMRLTTAQVRRLCAIDTPLCAAALDALVRDGFLSANGDGTYSRTSDSTTLHPMPVARR